MKYYLLVMLIYLSSCSSIEHSAHIYFKKHSNIKGVEPYESLIARMRKDQALREIVYGKIKAGHLLECMILRHQLYAASLHNGKKNIVDAAKIMESGYQQDDQVFLRACSEIMTSEIGQIFLKVQQEYR